MLRLLSSFLLTALFLGGALLSGCQKSSCEALRASAESCENAESPYVPESQSACTAARDHYGVDSFDQFADCVTAASCENDDAILTCQSVHLPEASADPCAKFTLWSVGCGLEPVTLGPECGGVTTGLGQEAFSDWVECVTSGGCPSPDDQRSLTCQEGVLPSTISTRLETCNKIKRWADQCGPEAPPESPISFNLLACLAQGQVVTEESFSQYGDCLLDMVTAGTCSSNTDRVLCAFNLQAITPSDIQETTCERLIQLGEACVGSITGNSPSGCTQLFSAFTEESFGAYVDCVDRIVTGTEEVPGCQESADFTGCLPLLTFPQ